MPYRSRETIHKTPFGAAASNEAVALRVIMPRSMRCRGIKLLSSGTDGHGFDFAWDLVWEGMQGEHEEWWKITFTLDTPAVYDYKFVYESDFGGGVVGDEGDGVGCFGENTPWRLTVYDAALRLPDWVAGGVMYQIFPDRFFASGQAKKNIPSNRVLRDDWGGVPMWQPNERGEITQYDFFGGDLAGIAEKLDYLVSLGVTCVYLNPIFFAESNHRYDTADYHTIDPLLGDLHDFHHLCDEAHRRGIHVLLDGVFSHTGAHSIYFNADGQFDSVGASQSAQSPYYPWYKFQHWPEAYACWWGVRILPELNESHPDVTAFFAGEDGVVRRWLREGADGWRLDVADELPDAFLDAVFAAAQAEKKDACVLGEVWEDAVTKISYGVRRRYLLGRQMHSVMNYPLADAIICFAVRKQAEQLAQTMLSQLEHYPPAAILGLMNHIGTHDTVRALMRLAGDGNCENPNHEERGQWAGKTLNPAQKNLAHKRLKLCAALQFTLPGTPCVYYGDEAGMQGYMDPFNRGCFPWGGEDEDLLAYYRALGALRKSTPALASAEFELISASLGCVCYKRGNLLVIANANDHQIAYRYRGAVYNVAGVSCFLLAFSEEQDS
ncbi:MAG: glycoside hydrolase family 13 protein [Oscillospiraceae bacterium]|nr:glycoside hydrolase family 13 protein [Oscillospiraceae bacterium]